MEIKLDMERLPKAIAQATREEQMRMLAAVREAMEHQGGEEKVGTAPRGQLERAASAALKKLQGKEE